jgi:hypothetical protein
MKSRTAIDEPNRPRPKTERALPSVEKERTARLLLVLT